jgi:hypothetical protein
MSNVQGLLPNYLSQKATKDTKTEWLGIVSGYPPFPLLAPVLKIVFVSFVTFCEICFPDLPLRLCVRFSILQMRRCGLPVLNPIGQQPVKTRPYSCSSDPSSARSRVTTCFTGDHRFDLKKASPSSYQEWTFMVTTSRKALSRPVPPRPRG